MSVEELTKVGGAQCAEELGGPLVVVCGLHGGAGASTLAYALAHRVAVGTETLLVETLGSGGDQAALAGVSPLWQLAAGPRRASLGKPAVAATSNWHVLRAAAQGYGLTVVDGGMLRGWDSFGLLRIATHVVWVTLAENGAAERARTRLRAVPPLAPRQALVVRADSRGSRNRGQAGELRKVAEDFCDRLIYMSDSPGTGDARVDVRERRMLAALTGLMGFMGLGADA